MKNIIYLLSGMLITFTTYIFFYSAGNFNKNEKSIVQTYPDKHDKKTVSPHIIDKNTTDEYIAIDDENNNTDTGSNIDIEEDTPLDDGDNDIYRKELKDAGEKLLIPIESKTVIPLKVNINSLIAGSRINGLKMKIKTKENNGIVKVKVMLTSLMVDKEEAEKKKIKTEFISYVVGIVNDKVIFETTTSGFMAENPLFKFSFTGGRRGDELIIVCKLHNGDSYMGKKKIK